MHDFAATAVQAIRQALSGRPLLMSALTALVQSCLLPHIYKASNQSAGSELWPCLIFTQAQRPMLARGS